MSTGINIESDAHPNHIKLAKKSRKILSSVPAIVLLIFIVSRSFSSAFLYYFSQKQEYINGWIIAKPTFSVFSNLWDAKWYEYIAAFGYPIELPKDSYGNITENAWAFMPVYSLAVSSIDNLVYIWNYYQSAIFLSLCCFYLSMLVFYIILSKFYSKKTVILSVIFYAFMPVGVIFQLGYAESLANLLLLLILWFLISKKYVFVFVLIPIAALTRPLGLALALMIFFYFCYVFISYKRKNIHGSGRFFINNKISRVFSIKDTVLLAVLSCYSILAGFLWFIIAAFTTGNFFAYTETEMAWRRAYIGDTELIPFTSWFQGLNWWFGKPYGYGLTILIVLLMLYVFLSKSVRSLPVVLYFWALAYWIYLFAVFFPQSSTFRLLIPLFVLIPALAVNIKKTWQLVILIVIFSLLQILWIDQYWLIKQNDFTVP